MQKKSLRACVPHHEDVPHLGLYLSSTPNPGNHSECTLELTQTRLEATENNTGTSLVVQGLRLCAPNAERLGSTLRQGTRPHVPQEDQRSHAAQLRPGTVKL